jgi:hypothetical protein
LALPKVHGGKADITWRFGLRFSIGPAKRPSERELRRCFAFTSSATSSQSIAQAAYRENSQEMVNANCSNAYWLRWCAGNLTEIFVIAFT